nr:hypothetical protein [Candidatus Paceibacterota bacterium]
MDNKNIKIDPKKKPKNPNLMSQIMIAVLIFMSITVAYSLLVKGNKEAEEITISDVAKAISSETVEKIEVSGPNINVIFKDGTKGEAKKEAESSLSETLSNYGLTGEQIANTPIEIKE